MRNLVRRYVTVEQRKAEGEGVTEDDVNEIKQDISAFRCELIEILKNSGMNTSTASGTGTGTVQIISLIFFNYLHSQFPVGCEDLPLFLHFRMGTLIVHTVKLQEQG
jgi:hypothetical protein